MVRYATDGEYALMAKLVYQEQEAQAGGHPFASAGPEEQGLLNAHWQQWQGRGWEIVPGSLGFYRDTTTGYVGSAYVNHQTRQVIVAHRGTKLEWGALKEDYQAILFGALGEQMRSALGYYRQVVTQFRGRGANNIITNALSGYQLGFTGHSLGAWLAEVCAGDALLQLDLICHTVTFESPGSIGMLEVMTKNQASDAERLRSELDVTSYLAAPNLVNVCNLHVGRVIQVTVAVPAQNSLQAWFFHTLNQHGMTGLLAAFEPGTGHLNRFKGRLVESWPHYNFSNNRSANYKAFHELVGQATGFTPNADMSFEDLFKMTYEAQYRQSLLKPERLSLRYVHAMVREFLESYLKVQGSLDEWFKTQGGDGEQFSQHLSAYKLVDEAGQRVLSLEASQVAVDWLAEVMSTLAAHPEYLTQLAKQLNMDARLVSLEAQKHVETSYPAIMSLIGAGVNAKNAKVTDVVQRFAHLGSNARPEDFAFLQHNLDKYPIEMLRMELVGVGANIENADIHGIRQTFFDLTNSSPHPDQPGNPQSQYRPSA